jgi:hypothetical protein
MAAAAILTEYLLGKMLIQLSPKDRVSYPTTLWTGCTAMTTVMLKINNGFVPIVRALTGSMEFNKT